MAFHYEQPAVGIGVMVVKNDTLLLGKRLSSHGSGEYAFPGGHLELHEGVVECAVREINEECGVSVANVHFLLLSNITRYAPRHFVHVGLVADWESGEPVVKEPQKCESWGWYPFDHLPSPLFATIEESVAVYRNNSGPVFIDETTD